MNKNYLLLTGAGFSRNWNGWTANEVFEYLLGCKEICSDAYLKDKLWKCKDNKAGFEGALGEIQLEAKNRLCCINQF